MGYSAGNCRAQHTKATLSVSIGIILGGRTFRRPIKVLDSSPWPTMSPDPGGKGGMRRGTACIVPSTREACTRPRSYTAGRTVPLFPSSDGTVIGKSMAGHSIIFECPSITTLCLCSRFFIAFTMIFSTKIPSCTTARAVARSAPPLSQHSRKHFVETRGLEVVAHSDDLLKRLQSRAKMVHAELQSGFPRYKG